MKERRKERKKKERKRKKERKKKRHTSGDLLVTIYIACTVYVK